VSDRAGAAITCGVVTDYGIITDGNTSQEIGQRKDVADMQEITILYIDVKKTSTRVLKKSVRTGKWSPRQMDVRIPVPHTCDSQNWTWNCHCWIYLQVMEESNWHNQPIVCIGADGSNSNVGGENRAIHYLEMMLGKPLHNLICQLQKQSSQFNRVVKMIVKFFAPMWFHIKIYPLIIEGPLKTLRCLQLLKNLTTEE
jgi:hypothetical protein